MINGKQTQLPHKLSRHGRESAAQKRHRDDEHLKQGFRGCPVREEKRQHDGQRHRDQNHEAGNQQNERETVSPVPAPASPAPVLSAHGLTQTEQTIVTKMADGLSNKEIAQELFLSEGTVKNYISDILGKLALRDRTQIAIFYWKQARP